MTNKTTWTPGPWSAQATPSSDFVTRRIHGPEDELIADVGVPDRTNLDVHTDVANAQLIALAPEMAEALRFTRDELRRVKPSCPTIGRVISSAIAILSRLPVAK